MKIDGYHHIGLIVDDADKSLAFYEKLGAAKTFSFPMGGAEGKNIYLVDIGGHAVIEIVPRGNNGEEANARFAHIALNTDDTKALYDKAMKAGAESRTEPREVSLGTMKACIAFVLGPDKETLEFFQVLS